MLNKYCGPDLETLPTDISSKIESVLRKLPGGSGMYVSVVQMQESFSGFKEVFTYDFGCLQKVFLNSDGIVAELNFWGHANFEEAFGLDVKVCPIDNDSPAEILCEGTQLERIVGLGHEPNVFKNNRLKYELSPSGPYMGRK